MADNKEIIVGIPCYNEELSIGKVVSDFRRELQDVRIVVVDNNSTDKTAEIAETAGAVVISENRQGKGFAVQRIFRECDCDALIIVDGDDTYDPKDAHKLLEKFFQGSTGMVVGNRIHKKNRRAFATLNWYGNKFLNFWLNLFFRTKLKDMQSGLRLVGRDFLRNSALLVGGFAIEPEMTIQALEKGFKIEEVEISLQTRKEGSFSKIRVVHDGATAMYTVVSLFRDYKPLQFFFFLGIMLAVFGLPLGWYSIRDYFSTGFVYHIPALIVSAILILASFISFIAGLILSSIKRRHDEMLVFLNRHENR